MAHHRSWCLYMILWFLFVPRLKTSGVQWRRSTAMSSTLMSSCPHSTRWESVLGNGGQCLNIMVDFNEWRRLTSHVMPLASLQGAATDMETKNQELSRAVEELSKLVKDTGEGIALRSTWFRFTRVMSHPCSKMKRGFLLTFYQRTRGGLTQWFHPHIVSRDWLLISVWL